MAFQLELITKLCLTSNPALTVSHHCQDPISDTASANILSVLMFIKLLALVQP